MSKQDKPTPRSGVETGARIVGVILHLTRGPVPDGPPVSAQAGSQRVDAGRGVTSGQLARLLALDVSYIRRTCQSLVRCGILTSRTVKHRGVPPAISYRVSDTFLRSPYPPQTSEISP